MAYTTLSWGAVGSWLGNTTTGSTTTVPCPVCSVAYGAGSTHICPTSGLGQTAISTKNVWSTSSVPAYHRPRLTKLTITGTTVILEDDFGNGLEIDLDILRRLMKFDEVEAFAALEALRR